MMGGVIEFHSVGIIQVIVLGGTSTVVLLIGVLPLTLIPCVCVCVYSQHFEARQLLT